MKNKLTLILLAVLFFVIPTVHADLMAPLSYDMIPFYPLILIVELIPFWLLANKVFSIKIGFWKSLLIIAVANILTSLFGTFIPSYKYFRDSLLIVFVLFLISFIFNVVIEFGIFVLFLLKKNVKKITLFWISLIVNLFSYLILFAVFIIFG